jgi:hypothetical protein
VNGEDGAQAAMEGDPGALAAARRARAAQAALAAAGERPGGVAVDPLRRLPVRDPLAFCIYTTVALLAWCLSPALVAGLFGCAGLGAYARAWRAGLRRSDCVLGDPRLVMLYLGLVGAGGLARSGWRLWQLAAPHLR